MYVPAGTSMTDFADAMLKAMKDPANVGYARLSQVIGTFMPSLHSCLVVFEGGERP